MISARRRGSANDQVAPNITMGRTASHTGSGTS